MGEVSKTRRVNRDRQAVWDALADFGAIADWASFVEHSSMLRGEAPAIGATRRIQAGRLVLLERIVEFDPPRSLAYEIQGLPERLRSAVNRWSLESAGPAATDVTLTTTISIGHRPPQRLAERVVAEVFGSRSSAMLKGLARHLEDRNA